MFHRSVAEFVERDATRCANSKVRLVDGKRHFFFFGREAYGILLKCSRGCWKAWGTNAKAKVPHFAYYLERHVELDSDSHGPWAREMLTALAGQSEAETDEESDHRCRAREASSRAQALGTKSSWRTSRTTERRRDSGSVRQ